MAESGGFQKALRDRVVACPILDRQAQEQRQTRTGRSRMSRRKKRSQSQSSSSPIPLFPARADRPVRWTYCMMTNRVLEHPSPQNLMGVRLCRGRAVGRRTRLCAPVPLMTARRLAKQMLNYARLKRNKHVAGNVSDTLTNTFRER